MLPMHRGLSPFYQVREVACLASATTLINGGLVGDFECLKLIQLKRDLRSKHDVTHGKSPLGKEAHDTDVAASGVELLDVHLQPVVDAVRRPVAPPLTSMYPALSYCSRCAIVKFVFEQLGASSCGLPVKRLQTALPRRTVADQTNKVPKVLTQAGHPRSMDPRLVWSRSPRPRCLTARQPEPATLHACAPAHRLTSKALASAGASFLVLHEQAPPVDLHPA